MDKRSVKVSQSSNSLEETRTESPATTSSIPNRSITAVQNQSSHSVSHSGQGSQEPYTPRIKKVLKSYQASATTSLNGPDWVSLRMSSSVSSPSSSSSSVSSPQSSHPLISTPPISLTGNEMKGSQQLSSVSAVSISDKNKSLSKNTDPLSRSTMSTTSTRFGEQSSQSCSSLSKNSNANSNGTKGDTYDPFLAPPPFPIQQPPIFTPPDQNRCERSETILEGETISCFTVGGEKRLCLPQILTTVLRDFSLPQINSVCDELQIFCSRCTNDQLEVLKVTGIIPASAPSCGLITKTDAERLCAALLYSNPPKSAFSTANSVNGKRLFTLKVYHECFGKCTGLYVPALYVQPFSQCIECLECHGLFAPQKFVCHSHRFKENRTCHWGFDSSNWRAYLLLAKDDDNQAEQLDDDNCKEHLDEMKSRFDFKRKIAVASRDQNQVSDPIKRLKCEESSSPSPGLYPYPSYLFSPYGWPADPSLLMYWYGPALASGASTNNASALAARLSAFKPWSASTISNGKHLSQSISQVMPQGFNSNLQAHKLTCEPPLLQNPEKITSKRLDRYIEPNVGLAPQTSQNTTTSIAQKALKANDKLKSSKEGTTLHDEDSFGSNNTFSSENSNLSDEENASRKPKSGKIFGNLELILDEHKLSQDLKLKIISEVENIISRLGNVQSKTNTTATPHKKKILNGIQAKQADESLKVSSVSDREPDQIGKQCSGAIANSPLTLMPVVSCSPTVIKREPNSSPLMADPKINCVH